MAMNDVQITVGARIRPVTYSLNHEPDSIIIGIDGDDIWVRPVADKDGGPLTFHRQALHVGWEAWAPPDGTNFFNVAHVGGCDCPDGGHWGYVRIEVGANPDQKMDLSPSLAYNLAAWILAVTNAHLDSKWRDTVRVVAQLHEQGDSD